MVGQAVAADEKRMRPQALGQRFERAQPTIARLVLVPVVAAGAAELRFKRPGAPTMAWRVVAVTGEVES